MNVLLIADHFPPAFAPRMGYLVRNLKSMGHNVYVVATTLHRDFNSFGFLTGYADKVYDVQQLKSSHSRVALSTAKGFVTTLRPMWTSTDTQYYKQVKLALKEHCIDCVLCSTSSFVPLMVAKKLMSKGMPVILDFRDIYEQDETFFSRKGFGGVMRHFQKKLRNKIITMSDAVVSVSEWHTQYLSMWNPNAQMIMNGFDEERFYPRPSWMGTKTRIVYTGTLATPQGDISAHSPDLLFEAIKSLDTERRSKLEVVFYTDENSVRVMNKAILVHGLEDVMRCEDWVSSELVPEVLAASSALLILSNHGSRGVMLTKSFEYLAMNRPVLCLPNPCQQLENLISTTHTGKVLKSVDGVRQYVEALIDGAVNIHPDMDTVMQYSRRAQAQQFASLMEQVVKSHRK